MFIKQSMGNIYKYGHGNKLFVSLDDRDHDIARNLQDFLVLKFKMVQNCSPKLLLQSSRQINFLYIEKQQAIISIIIITAQNGWIWILDPSEML